MWDDSSCKLTDIWDDSSSRETDMWDDSSCKETDRWAVNKLLHKCCFVELVWKLCLLFVVP